ncbi:MAG TPA: Calx-beta domain-containing protein, partial [Verrucomicrobiae bacterium]|nr:Calx-beta domain-containing protein [Verrucomicrobiae bacterium]
EPNPTPATATPLILSTGLAIATGAISPAGDEDYYSFVAPPGSKAWILVDAGGTTFTNLDSFLTLFAGDGITEIEDDDDDGTGNGCDDTVETDLASAIGGRTLDAGGTYYLRMKEFADREEIGAYTLYLVVTTNAPAFEAEPNNTPAQANPLSTLTSLIGVRSGSIGATGDVDVYAVAAKAGTVLYINADCDPERDGGTDLTLDLISTNRTAVLISVNSSGSDIAASEAFCFLVPFTGTYYVRVSHAADGVGSYQLMVGNTGAASFQFGAATYIVLENVGVVALPVIRLGDTSATLTVHFATSNGSASGGADYGAFSQTLTFDSGISTQLVSITITNDALVESNETVLLTLSAPSGGAIISGPNPAILLLVDDDEVLDNSPETARPLDLNSGFVNLTTTTALVPLAISPGGDADWFSFTAPPNSAIWAFVDTGGIQSQEASSRDSILTLLAADGITVIEEDDDDGSGSGCSAVIPFDGQVDSAIAGRTLLAGGTYYLRVKAFSSDEIINPYALFVALSTSSPLSEVEPNSTPGVANSLLSAPVSCGQRFGQSVTEGDIDIYSVVIPSNCLLYVSLDCDPERIGTVSDLALELLARDGTTVLFSADSAEPDQPAAEAFCLLLSSPGTYFVRVRNVASNGSGIYSLMAARSALEVEPNDAPATSVALEFLLNQFLKASGTIAPGNDSDYYSFVCPPGAKAWLTVDTGGPQLAGATS